MVLKPLVTGSTSHQTLCSSELRDHHNAAKCLVRRRKPRNPNISPLTRIQHGTCVKTTNLASNQAMFGLRQLCVRPQQRIPLAPHLVFPPISPSLPYLCDVAMKCTRETGSRNVKAAAAHPRPNVDDPSLQT